MNVAFLGRDGDDVGRFSFFFFVRPIVQPTRTARVHDRSRSRSSAGENVTLSAPVLRPKQEDVGEKKKYYHAHPDTGWQ